MADMTAPAGLMEHFVDLEDPRSRRSPHGLLELLLTAIGASIGGANSWVSAYILGRVRPIWIGLDGFYLSRTVRSGAIQLEQYKARWIA